MRLTDSGGYFEEEVIPRIFAFYNGVSLGLVLIATSFVVITAIVELALNCFFMARLVSIVEVLSSSEENQDDDTSSSLIQHEDERREEEENTLINTPLFE